MEFESVQDCHKYMQDLEEEFKEFSDTINKEYVKKLEEVGELQEKYAKQLQHHKYQLKTAQNSLKKIRKKGTTEEVNIAYDELHKRKAQLADVQQVLPRPNGTYLRIILGRLNVSILNRNDRFRYKDEYEKFKLYLSIIGLVCAVINLLVVVRVFEIALLFLLVWYYCTLTIRESILKVNGSRIKGWWRFHHFMSTVIAGVLLIWPNNNPWSQFRTQFMWFIFFISIIQYCQFVYQQSVLYRLKALGERHNMDITIEGFHSWMWRGLSFLLPILYTGYAFQLYNAYTLYKLSFHKEATWQVPVLAGLFFILFLGNAITTTMVIPQKFRENFMKNSKHNIDDKKAD